MTSEEMKLVKFETIIKELWEKLEYSVYIKKINQNPLIILFGDKFKNEYVQIVINNTFTKKDNLISTMRYVGLYNDGIKDIDDIRSLIEQSNKDIEDHGYAFGNISAQVVFFGLIILAIDNDMYNEKLNVLIDFAFLTKFNVQMINDWIYVVKKILMAEPVLKDEIETSEGKKFFARICTD